MGLQTEFDFTLPKGYIDRDGALHRHGTMRLATARDEIEPLRDPRVSSSDDPFLTILVIARVVTELGTLPAITPDTVENLFAADLAFLQDLYGIINFGNPADVDALQRAVLGDEDDADDANDSAMNSAKKSGGDGLGGGGGGAAASGTESDSHASPAQHSDPDLDAAPRRRGRIEEVGSPTGP